MIEEVKKIKIEQLEAEEKAYMEKEAPIIATRDKLYNDLSLLKYEHELNNETPINIPHFNFIQKHLTKKDSYNYYMAKKELSIANQQTSTSLITETPLVQE